VTSDFSLFNQLKLLTSTEVSEAQPHIFKINMLTSSSVNRVPWYLYFNFILLIVLREYYVKKYQSSGDTNLMAWAERIKLYSESFEKFLDVS